MVAVCFTATTSGRPRFWFSNSQQCRSRLDSGHASVQDAFGSDFMFHLGLFWLSSDGRRLGIELGFGLRFSLWSRVRVPFDFSPLRSSPVSGDLGIRSF
ncbi:hypothetical protein HanIR_Chr16g0803561 [Helianthus annuus]|nr:hypothetical protein HanIR_Chr16g0803561 [Helianthus annuus]